MNNLNAYDSTRFREIFETTDLAKQLEKDFDLLTWETDLLTFKFPGMTPRELRGRRIFSMVPFYYILQLGLESRIYDIGCGWNIYKKYLPNVIGIDAKYPDSTCFYADQIGFVNNQFVEQHTEKFENVMTMLALHFIPLSQLCDRINQIRQMVKPGGKIFIMMNVCHMINSELELGSTTIKTNACEYIRNQIEIFKNELLCFELDDNNVNDNMSEGTLRLVLQKHE
jgi:hypothetical protein